MNNETAMLGSVIGLLLWPLLPAFIAKKKGRSALGYYFLSWLISPLIVTIIVLCLRNLNDYSVSTTSSPDWVCSCGKRNPATVEECECGILKPRFRNTVSENPAARVSVSSPSGWTCSCGRSHAAFDSSCVCGKSKWDAEKRGNENAQ